MDPQLLSHVVTLLGGGAAVTVINRVFDGKKARIDELSAFRAELSVRLEKVENELDKWKDRYYAREEEVVKLRAQVIALESEVKTLRRELDNERRLASHDRVRVSRALGDSPP